MIKKRKNVKKDLGELPIFKDHARIDKEGMLDLLIDARYKLTTPIPTEKLEIDKLCSELIDFSLNPENYKIEAFIKSKRFNPSKFFALRHRDEDFADALETANNNFSDNLQTAWADNLKDANWIKEVIYLSSRRLDDYRREMISLNIKLKQAAAESTKNEGTIFVRYNDIPSPKEKDEPDTTKTL